MSDVGDRIAGLSAKRRQLLEQRLGQLGVTLDRAREIPRLPRDGSPFALSFAQRRLWFLEQLEPGTARYNVPVVLRLRGHLDHGALMRGLNLIVERHESLRTGFQAIDGEPVQVVTPRLTLSVPVVDLPAVGGDEREAMTREFARADVRRPFDLERPPLLRASLLRFDESERALLLTTHHIVSDGVSLAILVDELVASYRALRDGVPVRLPALPVQYADFSAWHRAWSQGPQLEEQLGWWKRTLADLPALDLPTDRSPPVDRDFSGANEVVAVPSALRAELLALSRREGVTPFMCFLATFKALLFRYTKQTDIVVGSPITNRDRPDVQPLIGFFVNTLVLRTSLGGAVTFRQLLHRVREVAVGAYAHQDTPFELLVEALRPERRAAEQPLFRVMFAFQDAPVSMSSIALDGVSVTAIDVDNGTTKFDLTLSLTDGEDGLLGSFEYSRELFEQAMVARMAGHLITLMQSVAADPDRPIRDIEVLSDGERREVVEVLGRGPVSGVGEWTLGGLVERQVRRCPGALAVVGEGGSLSYGELDRRANRLSRRLRGLGVGPEVVVGLCVPRGVDAVVGLLGIVKAGGAYLPLDPAYPLERLRFMIKDAGVGVLVSVEGLAGVVGDGLVVVRLDADADVLACESDVALEGCVGVDDAAYVIYTSGSSGVPKGVVVSHRGLGNVVGAQVRAFGLGCDERVLQFSSLSFDASVFELVMALGTGSTLCVARQEGLLPGAGLVGLLESLAVSCVVLPPSVLAVLPVARLEALRVVVVAGEACSGELVDRWAPGRRFFDAYGPTETTIWASVGECFVGGGVPSIGWPIENVQVYVVDGCGRLVPVGVAGELWVGGVGVARGYLGRAGLTAESFVPDGFGGGVGARLYRTGDVVRQRVDGCLEFVGRVDGQVKVRGFRVEVGEVEAVLASHAGVRSVAVVVRGSALAAFVVADGVAPSGVQLRRFVAGRLPGHMVPGAFWFVDELPLTPNGKLDRRALAAIEPGREPVGVDALAPRTPTEELLAGVWCRVLGVETVGVHDNFFELGGHSLLATQLVARMREAFGVQVPLRWVFEAPTVTELAWHVERAQRGGQVAPLVRVRRDGPMALSFAQQRLWFLDQLFPGLSTYNMPVAVRLRGTLDVGALEAAFAEIVRRHEVLRTTFCDETGQPVQVIHASLQCMVEHLDLRSVDARERESRALEVAREEAGRPFDLRTGPMLRWRLLRLGDAEHVLLVTVHHIASDGWSMGVLIRELVALYGACREHRPSPLTELEVQYADFAAWQRGSLRESVFEEQLAYWKHQLAGDLPILELPTDHPRPAVPGSRGGRVDFVVPVTVAAEIRALSSGDNATVFMTLLAAFVMLLQRYAGHDDIVVGSPIANRPHPELEGMMGFFVNTLVLRMDVSGDPSLRQALRRVRGITLDAYAHQDLPFEVLVEELRPARELASNPLFAVLFDLQSVALPPLELPDLEVASVELGSHPAKFDISLFMTDAEAEMTGSFEYDRDLFDVDTIELMVEHLQALLSKAARSPDEPVSRLRLVNQATRSRLRRFNDTHVAYPKVVTLHGLVEAQAERSPDRIAVVAGDDSLTYRELQGRANVLAHHLRSAGVGPEVMVALAVERSLDTVVALLAILKAGGAYVPLDPEYPPAALDFMLRDAAAPVVLTEERLRGRLGSGAGTTICVDAREASWRDGDHGAPVALAWPDNPAYMIYTSGSTGRPKGAINTHRAICNRLLWMQRAYALTEADAVLQKTSLSFDVSVWELFWPLIAGARLVMARPGGHRDSAYLVDAVARHRITTMHFVPSMLEVFLQEPDLDRCVGLRRVICSGEALPMRLQERFFARLDAELHNLYGPTEAAIDVTAWKCERDGVRSTVPIGWPIENVQVYVVDGCGRLVPVGVAGELWVGGVGVARGYLGRAGLTAESFVPDGFGGGVGARLYRTGDVVRQRVDGCLEFVGRVDGQVKVRGFRVEVGEVEAVLASHAGVRSVAVVVRGSALAAFVVADGVAPSGVQLRRFVAGRLPGHMVPGAFWFVDELPLTPNGKLDRRALAAIEPGREPVGVDALAPRTPTEELLAGVWCRVLGVETVGVHDNFFELGGHSLLATQLVARMREAFGVQVPLRWVFEAPTVTELAWHVERAQRGGQVAPLVRVRRDGPMALSFAQQRLWFLDQLFPGLSTYNMPVAVRLRGTLDVGALEAAFAEIVRRHEVLRTTFCDETGQPVQVIHASLQCMVEHLDLRSVDARERESRALEVAREEAGRPFDLRTGPMLRWRLLRLGDAEHVLLVTVHHIASDGWSMGVLIRELVALYGACREHRPSPLTELEVQYADFAAWQRGSLRESVFEEQLAYWKHQLAGDLPILELPTDHPRPATSTTSTSRSTRPLARALWKDVERFSVSEGATPFMTALTAFKLLLHELTGVVDLRVGTLVANRADPRTHELVGLLVNTVVLRTRLSPDLTVRGLIQAVRASAVDAFARQDIPLDIVAERLRHEEGIPPSSLFQVLFLYQDLPAAEFAMGDLQAEVFGADAGAYARSEIPTTFDVIFELGDGPAGMLASVQYKPELFEASTIEAMLARFERLLEILVVSRPEECVAAELSLRPGP